MSYALPSCCKITPTLHTGLKRGRWHARQPLSSSAGQPTASTRHRWHTSNDGTRRHQGHEHHIQYNACGAVRVCVCVITTCLHDYIKGRGEVGAAKAASPTAAASNNNKQHMVHQQQEQQQQHLHLSCTYQQEGHSSRIQIQPKSRIPSCALQQQWHSLQWSGGVHTCQQWHADTSCPFIGLVLPTS